jgi:hypothetical protein
LNATIQQASYTIDWILAGYTFVNVHDLIITSIIFLHPSQFGVDVDFIMFRTLSCNFFSVFDVLLFFMYILHLASVGVAAFAIFEVKCDIISLVSFSVK